MGLFLDFSGLLHRERLRCRCRPSRLESDQAVTLAAVVVYAHAVTRCTRQPTRPQPPLLPTAAASESVLWNLHKRKLALYDDGLLSTTPSHHRTSHLSLGRGHPPTHATTWEATAWHAVADLNIGIGSCFDLGCCSCTTRHRSRRTHTDSAASRPPPAAPPSASPLAAPIADMPAQSAARRRSSTGAGACAAAGAVSSPQSPRLPPSMPPSRGAFVPPLVPSAPSRCARARVFAAS